MKQGYILPITSSLLCALWTGPGVWKMLNTLLEIHAALQYHYEGVQAIYKDVLVNSENSV